jgi:hypothetical protein
MWVCAYRCGFGRVAARRASSRFAWACDPGATWAAAVPAATCDPDLIGLCVAATCFDVLAADRRELSQ